ncbi:hypothetical protein RvY_09739 [Ramazzottius varieornatus]|uniref:Uncharacterized protein n=1 Tax=Ramazzottius varieornatus TaxID=947166 RepID=A0A1D1VCS5_RAMVA|nr:hypothetical protein RvY_09739 [Ramazzottius varieornatus]
MVTQDEGPAPKRARPSLDAVPNPTDRASSSKPEFDQEIDSFMEPLAKILEKHSRLGDRLFFLSDDFMTGLGGDAVLSLPASSHRIQGIGTLMGEYIFPLSPPQKFLINIAPTGQPAKWKLASLQETARTDKEILYVKRSLKNRVLALLKYQSSFLCQVSDDQVMGIAGQLEAAAGETRAVDAARPVYAGNSKIASTSSMVAQSVPEPEAQENRPPAPSSPVASRPEVANRAENIPRAEVAALPRMEVKDNKSAVFQLVAPNTPPTRQTPVAPVATVATVAPQLVRLAMFPCEESGPGKVKLAGKYNVWIDQAKLEQIESTNHSGKVTVRALLKELLALETDGSTALLRKRSANGGGITNLVSTGFNNAMKEYVNAHKSQPRFADLRTENLAKFMGSVVNGFA